MQRLWLITTLVSTLVTGALPAPAEEDRATEDVGDLEALPPGPLLHGTLRLSLPDAIAMGVENNLDVQIARFQPLLAEQDVRGAWGLFDPETFADVGFSSNKSPASNFFQQTDTGQTVSRTTDGIGGFRGVLPLLGATYSLTLDGSRFTTNVPFTFLSPQYSSGIDFRGTFPLLKDLIWNQPWTLVKTTGIVQVRENAGFRQRLMDVVTNIELKYWDLVAAIERVRVAVKSLDTSNALLDQVETQYEVGVVSKVDVVEAEAGVAEREFTLIVEENAHDRAQDELIDLVLGPHFSAGSQLQIEPTGRPEDFIVYEIDVEAAMAKALLNRPVLEVAKREVELREVNLKFAENQRLPRFDVELGYGFAGRLAGRQNPAGLDEAAGEAPQRFGTYWDTFQDFNKNPGFLVRGLFSIPIPNRTARSDVSKGELELRRSLTNLKRVEQNIALDIRDSARNLESAQRGIVASERRRRAAAEQLRAERIRLEHGESTPFDVLQRERDLVDAESQKIAALQTYQTSVARLHRAQGTILKSQNVIVEDARVLR